MITSMTFVIFHIANPCLGANEPRAIGLHFFLHFFFFIICAHDFTVFFRQAQPWRSITQTKAPVKLFLIVFCFSFFSVFFFSFFPFLCQTAHTTYNGYLFCLFFYGLYWFKGVPPIQCDHFLPSQRNASELKTKTHPYAVI